MSKKEVEENDEGLGQQEGLFEEEEGSQLEVARRELTTLFNDRDIPIPVLVKAFRELKEEVDSMLEELEEQEPNAPIEDYEEENDE